MQVWVYSADWVGTATDRTPNTARADGAPQATPLSRLPISMNLSGERKHRMKSILAVISLALTVVSSAFAGIGLGLSTSDKPVNASVGTAPATINAGAFGAGWHDGSTIPWNLGNVPEATGLGDLGQAGSTVPSGWSGNGLLTLQGREWMDSGAHSGVLNSTVNGTANNNNLVQSGALHAVTGIASSPGQPGAWWEYAAKFNSALTPADGVTVTASSGGTIMDRLALVPGPAAIIAGAILLIPFALSTWPILRRRRKT